MYSSSRKRIVILLLSLASLLITGWLEFFLFNREYLSKYDTNRISLFLLINIHVVAILILLYLIIRQSIKLFVETDKISTGSNFRRNLLFSFSIFSIIPSVLVFFIAGKLITASIDQNYLLIQKEQKNIGVKIVDYKKFKSTRNPVYWSFLFTFILATLIILFLSLWCAIYLAKGISKPILELLNAMGMVKNGNWNVTLNQDYSGDLKNLSIGFNQMTKTLKMAHEQLEQNNKEMLMIIENIKEAVFYINKQARIVTYNTASKNIVEKFLNLTRFKNKRINYFGPQVTLKATEIIKELLKNNKKQLTKEINFSFKSEQKTLLVHITRVQNNFSNTQINIPEEGLLIIIEDLSDIVKMNKIKTWQQAASQIAHEIKNPLTPIQLATQHLQRKYKNILQQDKVFFDSTNTILNHVKIIKDLASHFSEYAQLPSNNLELIDINKIIEEIGCLYTVSYPEINFIYELEPIIPKIKFDPKKIKRVFVNLLDNSIRALNNKNINLNRKGDQNIIKIKTSIKTGSNQIEILFSDNGPGIPKSVKNTLFMPYVSTEQKNMGLGLAIVHEIVAQNGGYVKLVEPSIEIKNGASFQILLPI